MRKAHIFALLWVAVLGFLLSTASHAQNPFPQTLPANTVVGRMGAGQAGPAQAIPFTTLSSLLNSPLNIGTSSIIGGTNGYFLYDNNGVLGNIPLSSAIYTPVTTFGWVCDSTDHSTQALAALTAIANQGGGSLFFPHCPEAHMTATASGTNLTVSAIASGTISIGMNLFGNGVSGAVTILSQTSGTTGGTGVYVTSSSTTVSGEVTAKFVYRADSQLIIPNDAATQPHQVNFRFVCDGGGPNWDASPSVTETSLSATVIDLRFQNADSQSGKIESRGLGVLKIDHCEFRDQGTSNNTPFIHDTNTTLYIDGNTFVGSGGTAQDAIVLGGSSNSTFNGTLNSAFQGYGTVINANQAVHLNRLVWGRTFANAVNITNNSTQSTVGTTFIEFDAATCNPPDVITGLVISGNLIEMSGANMQYGITLGCVRDSSFMGNNFYDPSGAYVSDYRLNTSSFRNIFISGVSAGTAFSQDGSATQISTQTYLGAESSALNPFSDGTHASQFNGGAEFDGEWNGSNGAAGIINLRDSGNTNEVFSFGALSAARYIDGYNSGLATWRDVTMQPRGGGVTISRRLGISSTALTLSNGLTSNINLWASDSTTKSSYIRVAGPSAGFSIGGFTNTSGGTSSTDGSILIIYNSTAQAMTIINEDASSTAGNRIHTLTGANVTLRSGTSAATFIYDGTDQRWILTATN